MVVNLTRRPVDNVIGARPAARPPDRTPVAGWLAGFHPGLAA